MHEQCYSTCKVCKKSLHSNCLKVWATHKIQNKGNVTCPMCRGFFLNPLGLVMNDLEKWNNRFSVHRGFRCKGCGVKTIRGFIYKCLMCSEVSLCKLCFDGNKHKCHDLFFEREMFSEPWHLAPARTKKGKKFYL